VSVFANDLRADAEARNGFTSSPPFNLKAQAPPNAEPAFVIADDKAADDCARGGLGWCSMEASIQPTI
jgi:hypothetical protein